MNSKAVFPISLIICLALSVYFTAGAAAQSVPANHLPLTIYRLGSDGKPTPVTSYVFSSGDPIWLRVPQEAKAPLLLEAYNYAGNPVWSQREFALPSDNLLSLILTPTLFPPTSPYSVVLRASRENAPGLTVIQAYRADFLVTPAAGTLSVDEQARNSGSVRVIVTLLDRERNPKAGVRIGLFLREGESSLPITTETTDAQGRAAFQYGEALGPGTYTIEGRVLDKNAISAHPLEISRFTIEKPQTQIVAWKTPDGLSRAILRELGSPKPVAGRLLLLEQQLQDGNWTVTQSSYTDVEGKVTFSKSSISGHWRVTFKGDTFYASSSSDGPTSSAKSLALSPATGNVGLISPDIPVPCGPSPGPGFSLESSAVQPECGGGGGSSATITTLYLPPSAYATISLVLKARVTYSSGGAVTGVSVNFYRDDTLINSGITNSTGYASLLWTTGLTGTHTIKAEFPGTSYALASSDQKSLTISATPTWVMILRPKPVAFAWDLARPIVVTIVTLALAPSGDGTPAPIYIPPYEGSSSTPNNHAGFGWQGLNQTTVTVTINGTYTVTQATDWTRNFYLPACPNPSFPFVWSPCQTTPDSGHLYLSASLSPPSTLYTLSSTSLNVPYQLVQEGTNLLTQDATPPANIYVNVNASYPYLSVKMQEIPVALAAYRSWMAYSLGPPLTSSVKCDKYGCYNYYRIPVIDSSTGSDFAYLCQDTSCTTPAADIPVRLYSDRGRLCGEVYANRRGIAHLNVAISNNCTYPYYYLATSTQTTLKELFRIEVVSDQNGDGVIDPFYTNFQGYHFATYAPLRTGRYLLHMHHDSALYTVLYPPASYPDVRFAELSCCDVFLNVEKHPIQVDAGLDPGTPTILDNVTASVKLTDLATDQALANSQFNYVVTRIDPGTTTIASGTPTTNVNGTATLALGALQYGNYSLAVSRSATSILGAVSTSFIFTVYKAKPTVVISPGWIQNAIAGQTYTFRTSLVNNVTQTLIAVSGFTETVYVNEALYASYITNSGGNVSFSWTPAVAGQYKIEVKLDKQSYYTASSVTIVVSVARRSVVLAVDNSPLDPDISQSVTWEVYAYDMINNATVRSLPVSQFVNGLLAATRFTDSSGHATFTYTFSSRGSHNVTFASAQNATYNSAVSYRPLTAFVRTSLTLQAGTIILGQQNTLTVTLRDAVGTPLTARLVKVEINGVFYQDVTTNSSGQAQFNWRPENAGTSSVVARFSPTASGDVGYRASSNTLTVNIVPQTTTNTDSGTGGTQSVSLQSGTGQPVQSGLKVSIEFPSLGTLVVRIEYNGRLFQGSLHIWNDFGANCVAWVFGQCVFAVPYWRVHFDGTFNTALFQFVIDFFSGAIVSQNAGGPFATVDPNSQAFRYGATAVDVTLAAASAAFFAVLLLSSGAGEPAAGPAATAVMLAFALGLGLVGFLVYQDKTSRLNMLGGMLAEFGLGVVRYFVRIAGVSVALPYPCCNQLIPGLGAAWTVFWGIVAGSTPWTRVVLLTGLLTFFLAVLQVFLMIAFFA